VVSLSIFPRDVIICMKLKILGSLLFWAEVGCARECAGKAPVRRRAHATGGTFHPSESPGGRPGRDFRPRELTVSDTAAPDPAQIQRGSVTLTTALRFSMLLPREQEAIFSILRTLNTADELLPSLVGQPGWDAYPGRLLVAIVDNYRRELAQPWR
jgi:hypothetical protein